MASNSKLQNDEKTAAGESAATPKTPRRRASRAAAARDEAASQPAAGANGNGAEEAPAPRKTRKKIGREEAPKIDAAPATEPVAAASTEDAGADTNTHESSDKNKARKKPPREPRENVRTVDERLKTLSKLPSLKKAKPPVVDAATREVEPDAAPPPVPPAAPPQEPSVSTYVDRGATIPDSYGMDRLVVLVRDPQWIFVYWELKGGALERLRFDYSAEVVDNSRWVLRLRTPRDTTTHFVDIDLRSKGWYLKVAPDTRFITDLGLFDQQGNFISVLHGNDASTPRPSVSAVVDERWIIMRDELEKLLQAAGSDAIGVPAFRVGGDTSSNFVRSEQPRALALFSGVWARQNPAQTPEKK